MDASQVPLTIQKEVASIQETNAGTFEKRQQGKTAQGEAGSQGQQKIWEEGQNPFTGEKLNLSNAPDTMMVDHTGRQMGQKVPTALDKATGAAKTALRWMNDNPIKTYLIYKTARELGLPLGRLLHLASSGE